jgi:hypothetical protein
MCWSFKVSPCGDPSKLPVRRSSTLPHTAVQLSLDEMVGIFQIEANSFLLIHRYIIDVQSQPTVDQHPQLQIMHDITSMTERRSNVFTEWLNMWPQNEQKVSTRRAAF